MTSPRIDEEMVRHVATLARLELSDDEVEGFRTDLDMILTHSSQLDELDTTDVPPTSHSLPLSNVFREDVITPSLTPEDALSNAPEQEDGYFKVPAVIQEGGGA
ncbi:Asp-tRNA(Asn)/Glu-tRNA(Gln) amidotransferase GatCAB subunit C [candidate division BRC1 bacterium HGW-BRC1-1]|jgi:aspartyl-tRNA(Asn)/glutamyl-tRNA(Gln) amidotransferase subunit C|nr:MAG: Asp-tRNA(Asn)/Glu-tRNA(Gln) amidotransferase GatCAB subunit C [candidate division BRC1 bacterium HGW-BRC1-1]